MAPKRQTLDGLGTRLRARTYADSYVPRPRVGGAVSDVVVRKQATALQIKHAEAIAIEKATAMLTVPAQLPKLVAKPAKSMTASNSSAIHHHKKIVLTNHVERPLYQKPTPVIPTPRPVTIEPIAEMGISDMVKQIQQIEVAKQDRMSSAGSGFIYRAKATFHNMVATRRSIAMSAMSLLLFMGGSVALVSAFSTNHVVGSQVKALSEKANASVDESLGASDSDSGMPSEEKVPETVVNSYAPPADEPRYIYIPKIKNAKTRVLKMSVGKDNAVQTPRTTWDTGWYDGSSKPGDKVGSALIVGHVSGLNGGGVFYNLYRLTDGDEIIVEMGDGTKYTYKVVSKEEVPLDGINMNNYLVSKNIDKPGLTIMTCAGEYNPITQTFENRLAVFAVREN